MTFHKAKASFHDGPSAFAAMAKDAARCEFIDIVVAWTGNVLGDDAVFSWLVTHAKKVRLVTGITDGLSSAKTLHRALSAFRTRGLWIAHPDSAPMLHTKLYVFRGLGKGDKRGDIVYAGSANLSIPAAHRNAEFFTRTVMAAGTIDDALDAALNPRGCFPATEAWLNRYDAWSAAMKTRRSGSESPAPPPPSTPLSDDIDGGSHTVQPAFYQRWDDHYPWYREQIAKRSDGLTPDHWLRVRRKVLAMPGWPDPTAMDEEQWKRACGLAGGNHPTYGIDATTINWPLFGSVDARSPVADKGLIHNKPLIRDALAAIPDHGEISKNDWTRFRLKWRDAGFGPQSKAAASRLLALRRPDRFLPLTNASVEAIGRVVGHPPTTLDAYKEACDALWRAPWVQHSTPPDDPEEHEIWEARVALLDVLFYNPRSGERDQS